MESNISLTQFLKRHKLWILLLSLVLSGCVVKIVYNQLDWIIPWYLDDYVTLNPEQEKLLDTRLQQYLSWHRRVQMPLYADFLDWVADLAKDGFSDSELNAILDKTDVFRIDLMARLSLDLVDLFNGLSDQQIDQLFENIERENKEYHQKYIDKEEMLQRRKRVTDVKKYVQRWTGLLEEKQTLMIVDWSKTYVLMGPEFLQSRHNWQSKLKNTLKKRSNKDLLQQQLQSLFTDRKVHQPNDYQQKYETNRQLMQQLYLKLDASLSSEQRQHMLDTLHQYAEDFRELAAQS